MLHKVHTFRISKYNREKLSLKELKEEWTSVSDIGKVYNGKIVTQEDYLQEENKYLTVINEILQTLGVSRMKIMDLENRQRLCPYAEKEVLYGSEKILSIARGVLREQYWCRLYANDLSIHFGYDYYMYVRSRLDYDCVSSIVAKNALYLEVFTESPYAKSHPIMFWKKY